MQSVRNLDNISFADWFRSHGGSQGSIDRMWDPIGTSTFSASCLPSWSKALQSISLLVSFTVPTCVSFHKRGDLLMLIRRLRLIWAFLCIHGTMKSRSPCCAIIHFNWWLLLAAYALGFLDCEDISARCMLTIFQFFATKTDASVLRMLNGSPADRLLAPITDYIKQKNGRIHLRTGCRYYFCSPEQTWTCSLKLIKSIILFSQSHACNAWKLSSPLFQSCAL